MKHRVVWRVGAALAAAALLLAPAADTQARWLSRDRVRSRGHVDLRGSFGIWIGPGWYPWWSEPWGYPALRYQPYPYSYSYSYTYPYRRYEPPPAETPPRVYEPQAPDVQQEESPWYYCQEPPGYYPYVRDCPQGWTKVAPAPEQSAPPPAAERQEAPAPEQGGPVPYEYRWYYCQDPPGYYPYVRDCPKGWSMVEPSPAR